jgi:hypothetical protein
LARLVRIGAENVSSGDISRDPEYPDLVFDAYVDDLGVICSEQEMFGHTSSHHTDGREEVYFIRVQPDLTYFEYSLVNFGDKSGQQTQYKWEHGIGDEIRAVVGSKFRVWIDDVYTYEVTSIKKITGESK